MPRPRPSPSRQRPRRRRGLGIGLGLGVDPRLFGNGSGGVGSGPFLGLDLHLGAAGRFLVFDDAVDVGVVDVVLRQVAAPADWVERIARDDVPPLSKWEVGLDPCALAVRGRIIGGLATSGVRVDALRLFEAPDALRLAIVLDEEVSSGVVRALRRRDSLAAPIVRAGMGDTKVGATLS